MLGAILSLIGILLITYIFVRVRKMENESKKRLRELEILYSLGSKRFNKSKEVLNKEC